jgi:dihydroorotate dehydrogenase
MPPQPPEIPPGPEERGATEVIAAGAAVVAALTAAIQVGGQIKDKITKN